MRIFGREFEFNGWDIWHKGNFNPDNKAEKNLPSGDIKAIGFQNAFISSVLGHDVTIRGLSQLRFSDSNAWDWNAWAGLRYDSTNKKIYLGGPGGVFATNGQATKVVIDFTNQVDSVSLPRSTINGKQVANIEQIPTKLSQLTNDIGVGGGTNIIPGPSEPPNLKAGDWWFKEL